MLLPFFLLLGTVAVASAFSFNRFGRVQSSLNGWQRKSCDSIVLKMGADDLGLHGQNFKFMPIIQGSNNDHFPRIIQIAGVYPTLSYDELMAPVSYHAADPGSWVYDFSDPNGPQMGTVALPGSDAITNCIDPVVMIAKNTDLNIKVIEEVEVLVVVDRGDVDFYRDFFFVFKTSENTLVLGNLDSAKTVEKKGYEIVGKVALVTVPWIPSMKMKSTGFLEDDSTD